VISKTDLALTILVIVVAAFLFWARNVIVRWPLS
jgi:hypothetical protein